MKQKPVLFVNHVSRLGGAERSILDLLPALRTKGIEPTVATPKGALTEALHDRNIQTVPLPLGRLTRPKTPLAALRTYRKLKRASRTIQTVARQGAFSAIHAMSLTAALPTASASHALHVPAFWHCRDLRLPRLAMLLLSRYPIESIAISGCVKEKLQQALPNASTHLCLNAINIQPFTRASATDRDDTRQQLGVPTNTPLLLMVAHLIPWKRHDQALRTVAKLKTRIPRVRIAFAGSDPFGEHSTYQTRLHALADQLNIQDHCIWLGRVADMPSLYAAADLLLHPAEQEPFGRIICEAMAAGCPVVAVEQAGPSEIVTHQKEGLLAADSSPDALATLAEQILSDPALKIRLAQQARKKAAERFSIDRLATQIVMIYQNKGV